MSDQLARLGAALQAGKLVALVERLPGAGNNHLPEEISQLIIFDHHTINSACLKSEYVDMRPQIGATAAVITEYFQSADLEIPAYLAALIFYGIKSDTMGLGRHASCCGKSAY